MRALGSEGSPSARVRILSTVVVMMMAVVILKKTVVVATVVVEMGVGMMMVVEMVVMVQRSEATAGDSCSPTPEGERGGREVMGGSLRDLVEGWVGSRNEADEWEMKHVSLDVRELCGGQTQPWRRELRLSSLERRARRRDQRVLVRRGKPHQEPAWPHSVNGAAQGVVRHQLYGSLGGQVRQVV
ncbi:hypothetical protein E2C01_035421 [Portunus trituberculatus]|uniref:Uncharacterized protein n=1 Tax=Portunus trituberculatus TaxID=210409 RepID=A0A5B7F8A4_PORTR|nr:hypothetical protein [Portunus trituberculatus]